MYCLNRNSDTLEYMKAQENKREVHTDCNAAVSVVLVVWTCTICRS